MSLRLPRDPVTATRRRGPARTARTGPRMRPPGPPGKRPDRRTAHAASASPPPNPAGSPSSPRSNARSSAWPAAISTNREIGDRLFLSSRTVNSHLHRSFPILAVTARHQLRDV